MALKDHRVEPIMTAPRDQGRELRVVLRGARRADIVVRAYWWRHWSMPEGCWWCPERGVVQPVAWLAD